MAVRDPCACGSIACPSAMSRASQFRFKEGVHDLQLMSKVDVVRILG